MTFVLHFAAPNAGFEPAFGRLGSTGLLYNVQCREKWINNTKNSHKGLDYLEISIFNNEPKSHLNFTINDKSVASMLKLRTGNHTFSVEIDRYRNRKTYDECTLVSAKNCEEEKLKICTMLL